MPRKKQFDENNVLQKAMVLFWKQGYHATSVQDLVDHLGINRASLYDTFGGKKLLFNKALSHYRAINTKEIKKILNHQSSVKEGLSHLFDAMIYESVSDTDRKGCFAVNTATELIPGDEEIQYALSENKNTFEGIFYTYLKAGVNRGELSVHKDIKAIASFLFTIFNGVRVVSKIQADPEELKATIRTALQVLD